jgi:hypothetical protein
MSWSALEQRLESTSGLAAVRPWSVAEPAACVPARRTSYSPARSNLDLSDCCDFDSRRRDRSLFPIARIQLGRGVARRCSGTSCLAHSLHQGRGRAAHRGWLVAWFAVAGPCRRRSLGWAPHLPDEGCVARWRRAVLWHRQATGLLLAASDPPARRSSPHSSSGHHGSSRVAVVNRNS